MARKKPCFLANIRGDIKKPHKDSTSKNHRENRETKILSSDLCSGILKVPMGFSTKSEKLNWSRVQDLFLDIPSSPVSGSLKALSTQILAAYCLKTKQC